MALQRRISSSNRGDEQAQAEQGKRHYNTCQQAHNAVYILKSQQILLIGVCLLSGVHSIQEGAG